MKYFLPILFFFSLNLSLFAQDPASFENESDLFFQEYVENGLVNYQSVIDNKNQLETLVKTIESMDLTSSNANQKKSFYINAYNLIVIYQVTQNYPIKSVMDVPGFFDKNKFDVAGERLTLNGIEKEKLLAVDSDARLHFVLVCGANGCPKLKSSAYTAAQLEGQLRIQTKKALNDDAFIQVNSSDKKVELSEIFKWYKGDFESGGSVLEFINGYRSNPIPADYNVQYYTYDWSLNDGSKKKVETEASDSPPAPEKNLQTYTPSVLLSKGQWEFKTFQNLYTQIGGYDQYNRYIDYGARSTYFTSINQFTYGFSSRFNLGVDFWIKSVHNGDKTSSPFNVFQFSNDNNSRTALSSIGPRIRVNPFKSLSHFAINSTLLIPIADDQNGSESDRSPWLSHDAYIWLTKIYYDQALGEKFQAFFQIAPWYTIQKPDETADDIFEMPVDIFLSYFPTSRISVYAQHQFWPTFGSDDLLSSYFMQAGLGVKYQLIPGLVELELSGTDFYFGKNAGAGQTLNLGIRIIGN